jgi:hypothetical protein
MGFTTSATTDLSDPEEKQVGTVEADRRRVLVRTGHRPRQGAPAAEATDLIQQSIRVAVVAQEQTQLVRRDLPPREAMAEQARSRRSLDRS